nr:MAG TPA: hypothetical protein [Caudoviricetes sp.]
MGSFGSLQVFFCFLSSNATPHLHWVVEVL